MFNTIKVLLIEDNPIHMCLVEEMLSDEEAISMVFPLDLKTYHYENGFPELRVTEKMFVQREFNLVCAPTFSEGLEHLRTDSFDVILLDLTLPDKLGLDLLNEEYEELIKAPIIIYTATSDILLASQALHLGVQDYIIKGEITSAGLVRSIIYAIERYHIQTHLEKINLTMEELVKMRTLELENVNQQLLQKIKEQEQSKEQIQNSLKEKEFLLKEVHHRVKNNMAMICSFLSLESNYQKSPACLKPLRESQNRVRAMAIIHEKLYISSVFSNVDFGQFAHSLIESLFSSYDVDPNQIHVKIEASSISLNINNAIPLGLILNELVSNAFQYAFPDDRQGNILIKFTEGDGKFLLQVSDDGVGLPQGFNIDEAKTLGMQVITVLRKQLNDDITLDLSHGTAVTITFPVNEPPIGKKAIASSVLVQGDNTPLQPILMRPA